MENSSRGSQTALELNKSNRSKILMCSETSPCQRFSSTPRCAWIRKHPQKITLMIAYHCHTTIMQGSQSQRTVNMQSSTGRMLHFMNTSQSREYTSMRTVKSWKSSLLPCLVTPRISGSLSLPAPELLGGGIIPIIQISILHEVRYFSPELLLKDLPLPGHHTCLLCSAVITPSSLHGTLLSSFHQLSTTEVPRPSWKWWCLSLGRDRHRWAALARTSLIW